MSTRTIKCGHCQKEGHNRRTCPMRNVTIRRKVKKVKKVQNILDNRLKKYQSNTYSEFNRYGNLSEFRFYQFVVAYKKGLENYYKEIIVS